jgi:flagellar hook-basal body complex protein FliE
MTEAPSTRPSGRDDLVRHQASQNFEMAQNGGNWMVAAGFVVAALWLVGIFLAFLGLGGMSLTNQFPPFILAAGGIAAFIPAFMILMAGFMGRSSRRAAAANALVLEATSRLMAPAREAGTEGISFAEQMKQAAAEVDQAMAHALTAMKAMAGEIGDERLRLESVSYATSDNARDLATRLAAERQALEALARELRSQISTMSEAIPRQAQLMVTAARQASDEVGRADMALENRLGSMGRAGEDLSRRLEALDGLAREAATRTEALTFSITRIEDKLEQSRRTVDSAVRASEVAAAAASTTGDALKGAVASALDGARQANAEINAASRGAAEEAARALARLREAGEQAAYALRTANYAARIEGENLERRTGIPAPEPMPSMAPPPVRQSLAAPPPAYTNGHGTNGNGAHGHANGAHANGGQSNGHSPAYSNGSGRMQASSRSSMDDDLFEASADAVIAASATSEPSGSPLVLGRDVSPRDGEPLMLRRRHEDQQAPPPEPRRRASDHLPTQSQNGSALRDIISDISREESGSEPEDREEVAEALVNRLQSSGIPLGDVFKPRSKKRIASASLKGDASRREATREQAHKEVERVSHRLRGDNKLMDMARQFAALEQADALVALEQTQSTSRNASARLAAFLLVDAAL